MRTMREIMNLLETAPPQPKQADILDAIEHADAYQQGWTPADFDYVYLGLLDLDQIGKYDDIDAWLEVHELDDLADFREGSFPQTIEPMPPIIVITTPDKDSSSGVMTQIGDGRGRINYATAHGIPLHVWHMTFKASEITEAAMPLKSFVGTCVNSFDEDGDCTIPELPWSTVSDLGLADEEATAITEEQFRAQADVPDHLLKKLRHHDLRWLEADDGVLMLYDADDDVHYFFV